MKAPLLRRIITLFAGVALLPIVATSAFAGNFGSIGSPGVGGTNNGVWLTPNADWYVASVSLTPEYAAQVFNTLHADYTVTDLAVFGPTAVTSCTGSSGWELCVFDSDYGDNNLYGWNACAGSVNGAHPNQKCTMAWVRLNLHFPLDNNMRRSNACHEIGHSVGLRHPAPNTNVTSCMVVEIWNLSLTGHDRNHLNAAY